MTAPVNVKLQTPTVAIPDWNQEATEWMNLNAAAHGNPGFYPLTVKAAYVIGVIHDICTSVSVLLRPRDYRQTTYVPAYSIFASGVEILGRCVEGNETHRGQRDIYSGFKWLAAPSYPSLPVYDNVPNEHILVQTSSFDYTIAMLVALRHFAAHGQATSAKTNEGTYQFGNIDYEILSKMPPLIADGLERYWNELQNSDPLCNRLARTNIIALRNWPVSKSWNLFERDGRGVYRSITKIFNRFDWRVLG